MCTIWTSGEVEKKAFYDGKFKKEWWKFLRMGL